MDAQHTSVTCLIVGAGLSGLVAANILLRASIQVLILDQGVEVGGRLATRQIPATIAGQASSTFDFGAQFFTVRDRRFKQMVGEWVEAGLVQEWSRGFATADGSYYADGHPRFRGTEGMSGIADHLARNVDVQLDSPVIAVTARGPRWLVHTADYRQFVSESLILTPPVPESLALLDAGNVSLSLQSRKALEKITYEPCIAVMLQLQGPARIPAPGGMWPIGEPIAWISDNFKKGISSAPGAVTIHAGPEFSQHYWDRDDAFVTQEMLTAADEWLGSPVKNAEVYRWKHSKPLRTHPDPCLIAGEAVPLIFAGDAFAGPRVEGAVLSGMAAAEWLVPRLPLRSKSSQ